MSEPTEGQIRYALIDAAGHLLAQATMHGHAADRFHSKGRDRDAADQWLWERAYLAAAKRVVAVPVEGEL